MVLLNTQQQGYVLLPKLFHQIFILPVYKFIISPLLINLEIPHINYMHHQLTTSGNIMQEDMVENI